MRWAEVPFFDVFQVPPRPIHASPFLVMHVICYINSSDSDLRDGLGIVHLFPRVFIILQTCIFTSQDGCEALLCYCGSYSPLRAAHSSGPPGVVHQRAGQAQIYPPLDPVW